ncbi:MAG: M15 family metallopeptidase [Bacteroidales bacterium]|nr:M15 family metallopeptidase [Bacteroidales bacterium]
MRIFLTASSVLVALLLLPACRFGRASANTSAPEPVVEEAPSIPPGAMALIRAYPEFIDSYSDNQLLFRDGSSMVYDDGVAKSYLERLDDADPEDMFADVYYTGPVRVPEYCYDPGRGRCEALFKKMYGSSAAEVRKHLVDVQWFGQKIPFTSVNGAADSLRAVAADIMANHPEMKKYFDKSSSFYWRAVRGAQRLSAHSYGMTVDICTEYSNYWRWSNPGKEELDELEFKNRIPDEVIMCFERHGFIAGAKWYHFDSMHFEFRTELLYYGRE